MSKIKKVTARLVDCPLETAAVFATRNVKSRQYLVTNIMCDDGVEGIGATYCGNSGGEVVLSAIEQLLSKVILGESSYSNEALWAGMYQESLLHGRSGAVMRAIAALDTAIWDHNARAAGIPLWQYLGAYHEGLVPAYASGGYYYGEDEVGNLKEEITNYVELGFDAAKIKVGLLSVKEDMARIAVAREVLGSGGVLMLDANNAWKDSASALNFLKAAEDYNPFWIEEPFSPDDIESHKRLSLKTNVSIAGGEIESNRWRFQQWIGQGVLDIAQPDLFACGGITEWRKIANLANSSGVPVCSHAWQDFHAPVMASVENSLMLEYFVDNRIVNMQLLVDEPLKVKSGKVVLSKKPGFGFEFNEEMVSKFEVKKWSSN